MSFIGSVDGSGVVKLRQKTATIGDNNDTDDNKSMRRISYLRATQGGANDGGGGAFHMIDNDLDSGSPVTAVNLSQADGEEVETPDADTEAASVNVQKV